MKKILWATDGSEGAVKAGKMVRQLLNAFPESTLIALYVMQLNPVMHMERDMDIGVVAGTMNDGLKALAKKLERNVNERFEAYSGRVKFMSTFGKPATSICKIAEHEGVDIIVMGSHGYGIVDRMMLGSVSNSVVHRSHIPTLVVK